MSTLELKMCLILLLQMHLYIRLPVTEPPFPSSNAIVNNMSCTPNDTERLRGLKIKAAIADIYEDMLKNGYVVERPGSQLVT